MAEDPKQKPLAGLTGHRLAIAHLLMAGYLEVQISEQLFLSLSSVKKYVVDLKERLEVQSLHGLSAKLMRLYLEQQ